MATRRKPSRGAAKGGRGRVGVGSYRDFQRQTAAALQSSARSAGKGRKGRYGGIGASDLRAQAGRLQRLSSKNG